MNPIALPPLVPVLPELILALGAMALLMLGVFRGERLVQVINGLAIALLLLVAIHVAYLPKGTLTTFGGSFVVDDFARFLKVLALIGSAVAFVTLTVLLRHISAQAVSFLTMLLPFGALVFGATLYDEPITARALAGAALVALGLLIAQRSRRQRKECADPLTGAPATAET